KHILNNQMEDIHTLLLVIAVYLMTYYYRNYFFIFIFSLAIIMNFKKINYKGSLSFKKVLKFICVLGFDYLCIKVNNPLYYFFFNFLPFRNLFKGIYILIITSKIMNDKNETNIKENKSNSNTSKEDSKSDTDKYFLSNISKLVLKSKLNCLLFYLLMAGIHFLQYEYNTKYFVYFKNKDTLINPKDKYYICANLCNNEHILPDWIGEMKKLINYLGTDNVYFSVYENGDSKDKTQKYLKEFKEYLDDKNIPNSIFMKHEVDKFEFPKIDEDILPGEENNEEIKAKKYWKTFYRKLAQRISFLSILRNKALDYLYEIPNIDYNHLKVLYFNDIIFNYEDIINLLSTNKGDFDVTCGMDYYWGFYDTLVSIDLNGHRLIDHFPFYANLEAQDAFIEGDNIRVFSCWNGVIAAKGKIFQNKTVQFRNTTKKVDMPTSECTLFNYDSYINGFGKVIINPWVAIGYEYDTYYFRKYAASWTMDAYHYFCNFFQFIQYKKDKRMTDLNTPIIPMSKNLTNLTVSLQYAK
ncbi:MAG: glycosyltransferase family 69 protein, partial [archaeon]|nr:glycosyltransferase family 69 protein [archaeon]